MTGDDERRSPATWLAEAETEAEVSLVALYCRETGLLPSEVVLCRRETPQGLRLWCEPRARYDCIPAEAIEQAVRHEVTRLLAEASTRLLSQVGTYSWEESVELVNRMEAMITTIQGVPE